MKKYLSDYSLEEKRDYCNKEMAKIDPEVKRIKNPHEYYVDGTEDYINFKNDLIQHTKNHKNQRRYKQTVDA